MIGLLSPSPGWWAWPFFLEYVITTVKTTKIEQYLKLQHPLHRAEGERRKRF